MRKDAPEQFLVHPAVDRPHTPLCVDQLAEPDAKIAYREDEVDDPGLDRGTRHRVVLGFLRILDQDDSAAFLHGANAERAVRAGSAEDYGKPVAEVIGVGAEEQIDRHALAARFVEGPGKDFPIGELKL